VVTLQGATHDRQANGTANFTNTTGADIIAAAGAGVRIAVTSILVTNAHATVSTKVTIRDGTTARIVGYALAAGGGFTLASASLFLIPVLQLVASYKIYQDEKLVKSADRIR
jgi:hypothetical protein